MKTAPQIRRIPVVTPGQPQHPGFIFPEPIAPVLATGEGDIGIVTDPDKKQSTVWPDETGSD